MLHHSSDDLMVQQQMAIIDDLEYTSSAKSAENKSEITNCFENTVSNKRASTTNQEIIKESPIETINNIDNDGDDVIELDSSPEKTIAQDKKTLSTPVKESVDESNNLSNNSTLKENTIKMQPLEKVRETITKSNETSDIKASSDIKEQNEKNENDIENDQNKENLENNEIQNQIQNGSKDDNDIENEDDDEDDDDDEIIENKENQINEDNINEKSLTNEIQLNEKPSEEVTIDNEKNLELMDISEIPTITENNIDDKTSIKNDIKIEKIESISSNQIVTTNDIAIKINDILQKSPEPPTSLTITSNTSSTVPINRKRLRSRSNNDDDSNISNNIQLTSTPLANHKIDHKELNSIEQNSTITAATATVIPNNINANNYTNNIIDDDEEQLHPTKKLRAELETNFTKHNRILHEYIERTTNETPDDIDKHISQLAIEIQTLNDMIKAKELEWNNMLHLKKVKEEICFRLTRKKQVMELMATKLGEITNHVPNATSSIDQNLLGEKLSIAAQLKIPNITNHLTNSTSLAQNPGSSSSALAAMAAATTNLLNYSAAAAAASNKSNNNLLNSNNNNEYLLNSNSSSATSTSAAQNILQLRANMKSSDLAKEKTNAQKIHRLLVSRNILPKPSSTSSPATVTSGSPQHQLQQQQQLLATSLIQNISGNSGGGGASASQLATLSGLFGSATAPVVISTTGGGGAVQMPLPLSNVATGSLMSAHTPPGATQTSTNATASTGINHQPTILNNYLTAAAASVQQQLGELFNGHHNPNSQNGQNLMIGRQGVFKDVKSIIADYRQRHPEQVPRRGRRMKSTNSNDVSVGGSGQSRINSELNNLLNRLEANSRPSSNDSSSHHSLTNVNAAAAAAVAANLSGAAGATGNISFKDVLVQFAKMSGQPIDRLSAAAAVAAITTPPSSQNNNNNNNISINNSNSNKNNNTTNNITNTTATSITSISQNNNNSNSNPSTFPEVTLHPVSTTNQNTADQSGSLLHGILTKYSRGGSSSAHSPNASQNSILNAVVAAGQQQQQQQQQQQTSCAPTSTTTNYNSTFSPTLARLLTAPERITNNLSGSQNSTIGSHQTSTITAAQAAAAAAAASNSTGLNLTKVVAHNNEITITPVINSGNSGQQTALQHSLLQKQIKDALNISKNIGSGTPSDRIKSEYFMNIDDEADDSVDRLVIDEGGGDAGNGDDLHRIAPNAIGQEFHENEVPWCQGCKNQEAQFVCAGCGSQWYCSRECQVQAWDEHSETCTG